MRSIAMGDRRLWGMENGESSSSGTNASGVRKRSASMLEGALAPLKRLRREPGDAPRQSQPQPAAKSQFESLPELVVERVMRFIPPGDATGLILTSKEVSSQWTALIKTSKEAADAAVEEVATQILAAQSLADFRSAISLINSKDEWVRRELLISLGAVITLLPEAEQRDAISDFIEVTKHVNQLPGRPSVLGQLYEAALSGPEALWQRQGTAYKDARHRVARQGEKVNVVARRLGITDPGMIAGLTDVAIETRGRRWMNEGANAQGVALELGIDSTRLQAITTRRTHGPAWIALHENDDFNGIMQRYGVVNAEIVNRMRRVFNSPEARVARGANVDTVASRHSRGFDRQNAYFRLQTESIKGAARRAIQAGMSPDAAVIRYGLRGRELEIKRIAERRDAERANALAQQPIGQRLIRGAGNLINNAAKFVFEAAVEESQNRVAQRLRRGMPGDFAGTSRTTTLFVEAARTAVSRANSRHAEQQRRERELDAALRWSSGEDSD